MSEIASASVSQQLQMLQEQTRMTGALHEAQTLQLKMWPLVLFDCATSSFTWDPEKKQVLFTVSLTKTKKKATIKVLTERVEVLNRWVQTLLGDEWHVKLKTSGKGSSDGRWIAGKRKISGPKSKSSP